MKKKVLLSLCLPFVVSLPVMAQVDVKDMQEAFGDRKATSTKKEVRDRAKVRVIYEYLHQKDPNDPCKHDKGWTALFVGDEYSMFGDYYAFQSDSVVDACAARGGTEGEYLLPIMSLMGQVKHHDWVLRSADSCIVNTAVGLYNYYYKEPMPKQDWTLAEGDSIVAGIACKKALTHFRGRDWVAWYAPEIPIPEGPYKFTGLPGLVFCLYDTAGQYLFTLGELSTLPEETTIPIYRRIKGNEETREHVLQMFRNFCADPASGLRKKGVTIPEETLKSIQPKPFNPIELE